MSSSPSGDPYVPERRQTSPVQIQQTLSPDNGFGPYKWIANTTAAGAVMVLFAFLVTWGAQRIMDQSTEAHKATTDLYLKMAEQASEDRKNSREDSIRVWQAISENSKINRDAIEASKESAKINQETQRLMGETSTSLKALTEEVKKLQKGGKDGGQ